MAGIGNLERHTGYFPVTADASAGWFISTYAWWSGTHTVDVTTPMDAFVASCSATVL
jgi:hypothetical protein